ncbi:hypothetical protein [Sporomusa acidovorans]|nr:hypothetical protein [Sporomusa acidovorans]
MKLVTRLRANVMLDRLQELRRRLIICLATVFVTSTDCYITMEL